MSTTKQDLSPGVELLAVNLHDVELHIRSNEKPEKPDVDAQFSMVAYRPSKNDMIVEFGVTIDDPKVMSFSVKYRARFRRRDDDVSKEERDVFWKTVCAQLAPIVMYPYMRETLSGLTSKGGLPGVILPILNVGQMIDPSGLELPDEPEDDA